MSDMSKERQKADAAFRKTQKNGGRDGKPGAAQAYEADAEAARLKSERLKTLRLAKEAADREAASAPRPARGRGNG